MLVAVLAAIAGTTETSAQGSGTLIDLGTLGGTITTPLGINDLGEVVGLSYLAGDLVQRPFLWANGTMQQLDPLPGHVTGHAYAINNGHQAVGLSAPPGSFWLFDSRAVLWENGNVIDLNTPAMEAAGLRLAAALDINDAGQIVGYGFRNGSGQFAFVIDRGVMTVLRTLGGAQAVARSINRFGQISGGAEAADGRYHAVTWTNGDINDLGSGSNTLNIANGINDFGETAGLSGGVSAGATVSIPMFWDAAGTPFVLPMFGTAGSAFAINNIRQIAGTTGGSAVVWQDGAPVDLETLIPAGASLAGAFAINNVGQVVGATDSFRGFLIRLAVPTSGVAAAIDSLVSDAGVQASLLAKINGAAGSPVAECNALQAAAQEIQAQSGKKIPADIAGQLLDAIDAARTDCP